MGSELTQRRPCLTSDLEVRVLPDGTRLLKQTAWGTYLAVTPAQQGVLGRFDGVRTIQDVLAALLTERPRPRLRDFFLLVNQATEGGFLSPASAFGPERPPGSPARQWPVGWRIGLVLGVCLVLAPVAAWITGRAVPGLPESVSGWIAVMVLTSLIVSLAHLLEGCVLAGYDCVVYAPRIGWASGIPAVQIDTRDAFMGGRMCQAAVALQALAVPLLATAMAHLLRSPAGLFAAYLAMLSLTSPFGDTPAHNLLHALFRNAYHLPRCGHRFLMRNLFRALVSPRAEVEEERYLILYSVYAIVWLGNVVLFGLGLLQRHGDALSHDVFFAADWGGHLTASVGWVVVGLVVLAPLACEGVLLARNAAALVASLLYRPTESRLPATATEATDALAERVAFLTPIPLFARLPEASLRDVARAMVTVRVREGTVVIREGTEGDALFVVRSGRVCVSREDVTGTPVSVTELGPGDVFGEIALLDRVRRTATVTAMETAELAVLPRAEFDRLLVKPLGTGLVRLTVQVCGFLRHHELFIDWPEHALLDLACRFEMTDLQPGQVVIHSQAPNDAFFLIYEGRVEVRRDGQVAAVLDPGDYFGEISLLKDMPAVADVVSTTGTRCLRLGAADFLDLVTRDAVTAIALESVAEARLRANSG